MAQYSRQYNTQYNTASGQAGAFRAGEGSAAAAYGGGYGVGVVQEGSAGAGGGTAYGESARGVVAVGPNGRGIAATSMGGLAIVGGGGVSPAGRSAVGGGCMGCEAGCGTAGNSNLAYVGNGQGDWITQTTYKYVGSGEGNLAVATTQRAVWPWVLGAMLLAGVLAMLFWPAAATTTRTNFNVRPMPVVQKSCIFWGDPHLVTFDGARPSFYGGGEFWIVKSEDVHIQGRYAGTKYTMGLAAMQKVAVGGPFLKGHQIEVEPMEMAYGGRILVDGKPVLQKFGHLELGDGVGYITYNGEADLIDAATSKWPLRAVKLYLPDGVRISVLRWGNYLDMKVTMGQADVDGSCGNYNGIVEDDAPVEVFKRIGARVPGEQLMFEHHMPVEMTREEEAMLDKRCPKSTLERAERDCESEMPEDSTASEQTACVFDHCFGMFEHALKEAKQFATKEDLAAANLQAVA